MRVYQFRHIRAVKPIVAAPLAPRTVVGLSENRQVLEIARHAALELAGVARLALDAGRPVNIQATSSVVQYARDVLMAQPYLTLIEGEDEPEDEPGDEPEDRSGA